MALVDFTNPAARAVVRGQAARRCSTWASTASRPTSASASRPTSSGTTAPTRSGCTTTTRSSTTETVFDAAARSSAARARRCSSPARRPPAASSSRCTGAATASRRSSRWPRRLRGGLSLGLSGFGFWSHDIGGFEGTPDAGGVQALGRVRAALVAQPAARQRARTGCRGCSTRRRSTCCARFTRLKLPADALPVRGRRAGAPRRASPMMRADAAGVPRRPGRARTWTGSTCSATTCWSRRCFTRRRRGRVLRARRARGRTC